MRVTVTNIDFLYVTRVVWIRHVWDIFRRKRPYSHSALASTPRLQILVILNMGLLIALIVAGLAQVGKLLRNTWHHFNWDLIFQIQELLLLLLHC